MAIKGAGGTGFVGQIMGPLGWVYGTILSDHARTTQNVRLDQNRDETMERFALMAIYHPVRRGCL
jgi:hypothetical protein